MVHHCNTTWKPNSASKFFEGASLKHTHSLEWCAGKASRLSLVIIIHLLSTMEMVFVQRCIAEGSHTISGSKPRSPMVAWCRILVVLPKGGECSVSTGSVAELCQQLLDDWTSQCHRVSSLVFVDEVCMCVIRVSSIERS